MINIIALDLEGTLISNAMSQIPRPGLYAFLEECKLVTDRVVMFTTVSESQFRPIAKLLVSEGLAPSWFASIENIKWTGKTKDLNFIPDVVSITQCVLIDDYREYVHHGQDEQWIEIQQFAHPYPDEDIELVNISGLIKSKCLA